MVGREQDSLSKLNITLMPNQNGATMLVFMGGGLRKSNGVLEYNHRLFIVARMVAKVVISELVLPAHLALYKEPCNLHESYQACEGICFIPVPL